MPRPHRHDRRAPARRPADWKISSKIPIKSNIFPQHNGSKDWAFDLVGIFDGRDASSAAKQTLRAYLNYAYIDEANQFGKGNAGFFILRL